MGITPFWVSENLTLRAMSVNYGPKMDPFGVIGIIRRVGIEFFVKKTDVKKNVKIHQQAPKTPTIPSIFQTKTRHHFYFRVKRYVIVYSEWKTEYPQMRHL